MRIAIVASHYPPNFTSGGSLIPQRIAEGLARRGEEVFVFAGALDQDEPEMTISTECTDNGVEVTWVVINSMIDWVGEDNYRNSRVDAAFADFLLRVRPDVVHLHGLQGFGAGVASVAKAHGAAVVLTMHDMWWWCARQFLTEKDMRPCSPVVRCGVCPCENDNGWLVHRDRLLAAHLDNVDLVLAPSTTMMKLLQANGVDPRRLSLDENPAASAVSGQVVKRRPPDPNGPVRFIYAGGWHPLKGAEVTMQAARLLADVDGWTLDVYGLDLPADAPAQLTARPPYAAAEVAEVLASYDTLLMTSVATESYSLITREALDVGTTVISGDNPGPTEVIRDGENGLIVPRGDAEALADAMRSLIADRSLLDSLSPAPGSITLRTIDEQLDSLTLIFSALITAGRERPGAPAPGAADAPPDLRVRKVLLMTGIDSAPLRYRGRLPQEALAELGVRMDIRHYRDVEVPSLARAADAVVLYRVPATEQALDVVDMVRKRPEPVPVLFDIDDLVVDPKIEPELRPVLARLSDADRGLYWRGVQRYRTSLESADAYIGSTPMLCESIGELVGIPTHLFANGVGIQLARASDLALRRIRRAGPPRIGYFSGTNTHQLDWAFVEPAVLQVMHEFPDVELWLGGLLETSESLAEVSDRIVRLPLMDWRLLPSTLRDLDVNLAPLAPGSRFNEGKSAIKWLEAALVETATVASPTGPFRADIDHLHTGLLADTVEDWAAALRTLLSSEILMHKIGHAAHTAALLRYSPNLQGRRYLDILNAARATIAAQGHREIFTDWDPVYDSEPFIPIGIEPYDGLPAHSGVEALQLRRSTARMVGDYKANAISYLRSEGATRTFRKAGQVAIRLPRRALRRIR